MVTDLLLVVFSIICSFVVVVVLIAFGESSSCGFDPILLLLRAKFLPVFAVDPGHGIDSPLLFAWVFVPQAGF